MTIITEPTNKTKAPPTSTPVRREVDSEAQNEDEHSPLLAPPPSYSPSSSAPSSSKPLIARRSGKLGLLAVVALVSVALGMLLFHGSGSSNGGGQEDWMSPPLGYTPLTPKPIELPSRHTHESHPNWPSQPLFSRTTDLTIPLTSSKNDFFFHAIGADAVGKVDIVRKTSKVDDGVVGVRINVIYASEEVLNERVRIWKVRDDDGTVGVDILTPAQPPRFRRSIDYISFEVTIYLPASYSAHGKSSDSLSLGAFEGRANGMALTVGDLAKGWSFKSFLYQTRNSPISVTSLNSHEINLQTTNGRILSTGSVNATTLQLTSTNAQIDLASNVKANKIDLRTTNGHVSSPSSQSSSLVVADSIEINTTNDAIRGSWEAKTIQISTTNGKVEGVFFGIEEKLKLHTTNSPISASISLASQQTRTPIPIDISSTSGAVSVNFLPLGSKPYAAVDAVITTSNDNLFVDAPWFLGTFDFTTSNYQKIELVAEEKGGRKLQNHWSKGGMVSGEMVDSTQRDLAPGTIKGTTTNGNLKVRF